MAPVRPCSRWPRRLCRPQPASQCLGRGTSRRQRWRPGHGHLCSTASDSRNTSRRCAAHLSPWKRADSTDAPLRTRDARMDFVPTLLPYLVGDFRACPCRASEADDVGRGFPDGAQREIGVVHAAGQDHGEIRKDLAPLHRKGHMRVVSENGKNRTLSRSSAPRCKQPARRRAVDDAGESWALPATPALRLNRRAFHRAEGTEHAAVAGVGAQQRLAVAALVEELAGVGRHGFLLGISTAWARQHGLQDNGTHGAPCPVARTLRLTLPLLARCATT